MRLVYQIQRSCKEVQREYDKSGERWKDWAKIRGLSLLRGLTGKCTAWESEAKKIKRYQDKWTAKKKFCEDKLSRDGDIVKVGKWIKKEGDPEPQLDVIKRRVMPDGEYENAAQWFLDGPEFEAWCDGFLSPECRPAAKRVLWLRGTYGTGKTTLLYHTYSALKGSPEFHVGSRVLRVVPYFCDASNTGSTRPDYETIIRALVRRLSLLPDFTLAKPAQDLYNSATSTRGQGDDPEIGVWEDLFEKLIDAGAHEYQFVFIVDALDECRDLPQVEKFLKYMKHRVMGQDSNVYLLCSSHQQVRVSNHFHKEILQDVEVTAAATAYEMERFVNGELERRKEDSGDSIFYNQKHPDLFDDLRKLLLENARGMFRWVQIWLDILLPTLDDQNTIRKRRTATERLEQLRHDATHTHNAYQQLESGYQRLWDFNDLSEYRDQRVRLFQIIFGAFKPQPLENLREALRIQGSEYDEELTTEQVQRLYSNFLYEDSPRELGRYDRQSPVPNYRELRFVHESARKFVSNLNTSQESASGEENEPLFSERKNHLALAEMYIDVVGLSTHPFWQATGLEPSNWTELNSDSPKAGRLLQDLQRWETRPTSFHVYLARHGLEHCAKAAKKRSIFDETWSKVLKRVVLDPSSAFGFILLAEEDLGFPYIKSFAWWLPPYFNTWCLLGDREGRVRLLYSHVLASLDIIHEDDVSCLAPGAQKLCGSMEEDHLRRLFEHAACIGGDFLDPLVSLRRNRRWNKATALQLACIREDKAAVKMILQDSHYLSDDDPVALLNTKTDDYDFPICIATVNRCLEIVEGLLNFERCHSGTTGGGSCISKQWSLGGLPAFHIAIGAFDEDQMLHLLSIARPEDINMRDSQGFTVLHEAARLGLPRLARELVEKYDADIKAKGPLGWTPPFVAFEREDDELVEYFKSRGANVYFNEEDRR